jgi:tetratricopeptide (TPR) repeat protein
MRHATTLIPALLLTLVTAAHAADPASVAAARRQLTLAVTHGNAEELRGARASFARLVAAEPQSAALNYWLALADWRITPMVQSAQPEEGKRLCKEGIAACDRAIADQPRFADAIALRAGLQGLALSFMSPSAAMSIGPEMEEAYGRAEGLAPDNPRVAFLKALNTLHKPTFVGGGAEKARGLFERAIALADRQPAPDSTAIDWGREDAHLWSGRCLEQLGDFTAARERYREVLATQPEHAWVKYALLPGVEKQLAEKEKK